MAVALVAKNKTKISFFLCTNFLLFYRHKHFPTRALLQMHLEVHRIPPDDQMFTRALCTLLSFHLSNQSIKKALFRPLNLSFQYGSTINQNKGGNSIHQKNIAKLCRIYCNMAEKKKYEVKNNTDSIENHFYINR